MCTQRPPFLIAIILATACQDGYPLAPTPCDDFCYATQRAGCPDDYPEGCVSQCEDDGVLAHHPECQREWDARNRCYLDASDTAFVCAEGSSVPDGQLCLDERRQLLSCIAPEAELCLDDCFRKQEACGGDVGECDSSCTDHDASCSAEERAYYQCSARHEVDCSDPGEDTRPAEEIPCLAEIGAWFDCLGWQ
jgi:hypothetical protein